MDENNENVPEQEQKQKEQQIERTFRNIVSKMPKIVKSWIKKIALAIGLVLLAAGIINVLIYGIIWLVSFPAQATENLFTPDQQRFINTRYADLMEATSEYEDIITIGEDGQYVINAETSELVVKILESNALDTEAIELTSDEFGNMIQKYIEAEMKTLYPKTNAAGNEIDGSIIIKRKIASTGELIPLNYQPWKDFKDRKDETALTYFSINPEDLKIYIAERGNSIIYKDYNGNKIEGKGSSTGITIQGYDYQTLVQNYSLPFNFWIILHVMSYDVNFMNSLVDQIINDENPIEITFVESSTQQTTTINYEGHDNRIYEYQRKILIGAEDDPHIRPEPIDMLENQYKDIDNSNALEYASESVNIYDYHEQVITSNSVQIYVTKAESLFKKTESEINEVSLGTSEETQVYKNEKIKPTVYVVERTPINSDWIKIEKRDQELYEYITQTNTGTSFTVVDVGESQIEQKVIEFANMLKEDYPKVAQNLRTASNMIFSFLQQYENTQQHEKIMRFVIAMLDGKNHGVGLDDLEYLLLDSSSYQATISSIDLLERYYKKFVDYIPETTIIDGEKHYVIVEDEEGNPSVGNRIDPNEFSGIYSIEIGDTIPAEVVDNREEEILLETRDSIKRLTTDLELDSHQINALTLRAYDFKEEIDYGLGNFIELYKNTEYWDPKKDDKFEEETTLADYNVKLFTDFWIQPYDINTVSKRQSEWTLFQTGYYDRLGKREPKVSAEKILEMCESVMNDLLRYNVRYSLTNLKWNDIEKSNNFSRYGCCCATYVSVVLYRTGALTKEQINPYNYNYCGSGGMNDMLKAAGWKKVSIQDAQPGDVGVWPAHTFIYAGGNEIWDQNSGCISSDGDAPRRGTLKCWNSYKSKSGLIMWRIP